MATTDPHRRCEAAVMTTDGLLVTSQQQALAAALRLHGGHIGAAAGYMGVSRRWPERKMRQWGWRLERTAVWTLLDECGEVQEGGRCAKPERL
jgi:DNA-binding NtrC family response regulator